jgi:hypothetical protein
MKYYVRIEGKEASSRLCERSASSKSQANAVMHSHVA